MDATVRGIDFDAAEKARELMEGLHELEFGNVGYAAGAKKLGYDVEQWACAMV